jgi:hypothetical protein
MLAHLIIGVKEILSFEICESLTFISCGSLHKHVVQRLEKETLENPENFFHVPVID